MQRIKIMVAIASLAFGLLLGWRVGANEVANIQLQDDMQDLASQSRNYIRYTPPRSDDDFREAVIRKAQEHGIKLAPNQVTVERLAPDATPNMHLAADYKVPVNLPWFSFHIHFKPSSEKNLF